MRYGLAFAVYVLTLVPLYAAADHAVNINTADKAALMTLTGIGDVKAQAIIDYRASNQFDTIEEIMDVSGIGTATYNNIKDHIVVGSTQSTTGVQTATTTETSHTSTQTQTQTQTQTNTGTPVSSYVAPPEPVLFADAGADRIVIVGADSELRGRAYNKAKETVTTARLNWNFGDGTTKEGAAVMHHWDYPGTYAVVLTVAQHLDAANDRMVVKAEPAKLGFFVQNDGSVVIENLSGRDLDLSRWIVSAFNREFVLPPDSVILADASMRISAKTLGFFAGLEAQLEYPNGATALAANQASVTKEAAPSQVTSAPLPQPPTASAATAKRAPAEEDAQNEPVDFGDAPRVELSVAEAAAAAPAASSSGYWWLGALALAGLTSAGLVVARRYRSKEWDIIEDNG